MRQNEAGVILRKVKCIFLDEFQAAWSKPFSITENDGVRDENYLPWVKPHMKTWCQAKRKMALLQ